MHALGVTSVFGPVRLGLAPGPRRPGQLRRARPARRPHVGPARHVLRRRSADRSTTSPSATPTTTELRAIAVEACRAEGVEVHDGGTVVTIQGPRFSTRAESQWFGSHGWEVINMTQHPEAVLCREAGLRYAAIALITDFDAGLEGAGIPAVTQEEVFAFFEANVETVRRVLFRALQADLPTERIERRPGLRARLTAPDAGSLRRMRRTARRPVRRP